MDQINPFTNAPTNAPVTPPPQPQTGKQPAPQQGQAGTPKPATPPKQKTEFDIKHIIKIIVMVIIGVVIAKLAFDSVVPMFKPQPEPQPAKITAKGTTQKTSVPAKKKTGKGGQAELSLSETFAAAKKAPKPVQTQTEPFVVNGIFISERDGTASAIINNKVVTVGDTVDGAVVKSITAEGVELMRVDEIIKLRYR